MNFYCFLTVMTRAIYDDDDDDDDDDNIINTRLNVPMPKIQDG